MKQAKQAFGAGATTGLRKLKFLEPIVPGDHVRLHLNPPTPERWIGFRIERDGVMCSSGEVQIGVTAP